MFEFNFEVNEPNSSNGESPFDKPKLDQDKVDHRKFVY